MPETPPTGPGAEPRPAESAEACEFCGAEALTWRKCKQVCLACGHINRSCADL